MKTFVITKGLYRKTIQADYMKYVDNVVLLFNVTDKHHELIAVIPNKYKIIQ